ncbi:putative adhesin [Streptomyces sp. NPDC001288]|uniref:putative adhesin n=1 Tax=Streptomyces sp. NPDC001297 TaxID=3364559 RepID=UPI00368F4CD5
MVGYVLLGHGGLDVDPAYTRSEMEIVAIPEGTTIQFYCDTNQELIYGARELDVWEKIKAPFPPLRSSDVTYNLTLQSNETGWLDELANHPTFRGCRLFLPGRTGLPAEMHLCTGTPATCPTTPQQVAGGMTHECDGVLGTVRGALHWVACATVFFPETDATLERAAAQAVIKDKSQSVLLGQNPDWTPDAEDQQVIARANRNELAGRGDGESMGYVLGGFAFLIGANHDLVHAHYALYQGSDTFRGSVVVRTDPYGRISRLDIADVPLYKREIVRAALSLFTDAQPLFVSSR